MSKNKPKNKAGTKDLSEATAEIPAPRPFAPGASASKPEVKPTTKSVRAIKKGFYGGHIKEVGVVFDVPIGLDAKWFQDEDLPMPEKKKPSVLIGQSPVAVAKATGPAIPKGKFAEGHVPKDWEQ